jgi:hypothetical protein
MFNDGTYPDYEPAALRVSTGSDGEIVAAGYHEAAFIPICPARVSNGQTLAASGRNPVSDRLLS